MRLEVLPYTKTVAPFFMSFSFSVVMICRDAETTIGHALEHVRGLSDDVVVYDSGSTDGTLNIVRRYDVQLHQGEWLGFGRTRQKATDLARHDWVLMIDADEVVTKEMQDELKSMPLPPPNTAYRFCLHHIINGQPLHWGQWRHDCRVRLYNRKVVRWSDKAIHETVEVPQGIFIKTLRHGVLHYPAQSIDTFAEKMKQYALLTAAQHKAEGKRSTWMKRNLSPGFNFLQNYIFRLGFLDGSAGFRLARIFSRYTAEKYKTLKRLGSQ
jgi:glycosyltransferase involved in cell wall biosynthesis